MSNNSKIEWTDHTFNGWWGCVKISPGCSNCYAATLSRRYGFSVWGMKSGRRYFGDKHWVDPILWNRKAEKDGKRKRVFCGSMMDICEVRKDLEGPRKAIFDLVEKTPWLDWLFLSKRPEEYKNIVPTKWLITPQSNVWLGTTVENHDYLSRIDALRSCPAVVHFLSIEPLLGPLQLTKEALHHIEWVIVGGESGHNARPMHPDWVDSIRDACSRLKIPFFFKQWGEWLGRFNDDQVREVASKHLKSYSFNDNTIVVRVGKKFAGRLLHGREWNQFPNTHAKVSK